MNVAIAGEEVLPGGSEARRFVYGGVEFDVLGESAGLALDVEPDSAVHFPGDAPSFASVTCDVRGTPQPVGREVNPTERQILAHWSDDGGVVEGRGIRARLRPVGQRRFVAAVEHRLSPLSSHPVEEALAHALVEYYGGVVLHAAAVSLGDEGTVLFIGPSGAGKTTACMLTGQPFFAQDKLALVPREDGEWWAWPLLGGTMPTDGSLATESALPVAAICRVRQASSETRVAEASAHRAVFIVRESCFANTSLGEDGARLEAIMELCGSVPIAELDTVLGTNPLPVLRSWLA